MNRVGGRCGGSHGSAITLGRERGSQKPGIIILSSHINHILTPRQGAGGHRYSRSLPLLFYHHTLHNSFTLGRARGVTDTGLQKPGIIISKSQINYIVTPRLGRGVIDTTSTLFQLVLSKV